ncbi:MAG: hypothetical protein F4X18_03835 [Acidimicrobiia bacterium]|nr:hypothetical protein [Acidimicrobiia bacterium]MYB44363.1 hypothetical protein [Acidimicrobiia bacterium]MYC84635.1 hypothetical protein [Acidimicrobiia bacterium]
MSLLVEALRSALLPCSYSILLMALVLLGLRKRGERAEVLGLFYLGTVLLAWLPLAGVNLMLDHRLGGAAVLGAGLALTASRFRAGAGGAALVGAFAGATWLPCVGPQLGSVLTRGLVEPSTAVLPLALYLAGVMVPSALIYLLAAKDTGFRSFLARRRVRIGFQVAAALLPVAVVTGGYDRLVGELARLSNL